MRARPAWALALLVGLGTGNARAATEDGEKLGVLLLGAAESDAELADNITEVIIAHLAERRDIELAGTAEFRSRLGAETEQQMQACLNDPECVGRAAVSLGVSRLVLGTVGGQDAKYLFSLTLEDVRSGRTAGRVFRTVDGPAGNLIHDVRAAVDELFRPPPPTGGLRLRSDLERARVSVDYAYAGVTPLVREGLTPGVHVVRLEKPGHFAWASDVAVPAGSSIDLRISAADMPERLRWPSYAAYGLAGAAIVDATGGILLGVTAQSPPASTSREVAQQEFDRHQRLGLIADVMLISSAVLATASAYLFLHYRRHIFGSTP